MGVSSHKSLQYLKNKNVGRLSSAAFSRLPRLVSVEDMGTTRMLRGSKAGQRLHFAAACG